MKRLVLATALLLAACGSDDSPSPPPPSGGGPSGGSSDGGSTWTIGPIIDGESGSPGMPRKFGTWFEFPRCSNPINPDGPSVHYVTKSYYRPPLTGTVTLTYEISGDGVVAATEGTGPGVVQHFQRQGDTWTYKGDYRYYRWWTLYGSHGKLTPGQHTLTASFENLAHWGGASGQQKLFADAKRDPQAVGFTFGGNQGLGHGVCLTSGSLRFTVKSWQIVAATGTRRVTK